MAKGDMAAMAMARKARAARKAAERKAAEPRARVVCGESCFDLIIRPEGGMIGTRRDAACAYRAAAKAEEGADRVMFCGTINCDVTNGIVHVELLGDETMAMRRAICCVLEDIATDLNGGAL